MFKWLLHGSGGLGGLRFVFKDGSERGLNREIVLDLFKRLKTLIVWTVQAFSCNYRVFAFFGFSLVVFDICFYS